MANDPTTRREFLQHAAVLAGAGTLLGAGALSGCGTSQPAAQGSPSSTAAYSGSKAPFILADWGGITATARRDTWGAEFTRQTGVPVESTPLDYGKFVAQIESQKVTWNWIDAEGWFAYAHPDLLVDIPYAQIGINKEDYFPIRGAILPKALISYHSCYAIGYRTDKKMKVPKNWVEFFDTKAIPGKRALYNWPYGTIEIALLADGVAYADLYPLNYDRAFKKIDSIRDDLVFWNTGAESQQFLVSGAADFVQAWHNRVGMLAAGGMAVDVEWGQNLQIVTHHLISKYQPRPELCVDFIKAATDPKSMAAYANLSLNSPAFKTALDLVAPEALGWMSTTAEHLGMSAGAIGDEWWGANLDEASNKWSAFVGG